MAKKAKAEKKSGRTPQFWKNEVKPGMVLRRDYKGKEIVVNVKADGFHFGAKHYTSLSKLASDITGTSTNGPLWFHLGKYEAKPKKAKPAKKAKAPKKAKAAKRAPKAADEGEGEQTPAEKELAATV